MVADDLSLLSSVAVQRQPAFGKATRSLVKSPQCRSEETRQNIRPLRHAKGEGHARADLAGGLAIDARSAQSEVDCNIVLDLPDRPDRAERVRNRLTSLS